MNRLATGSSIEKGWAIINILRETTAKWPPPNIFVLILPEPTRVEVWAWSPMKKDEVKFLKSIVRDFIEGK